MRLCFHYRREIIGPTLGGYIFVRAYKINAETHTHVKVKHWYGWRWHPKNDYWRPENVNRDSYYEKGE